MNYSLELIVVPVTDIDRAKQFYSEQVGFHVDVDVSPGGLFRIVQLTPPGSTCSITLMKNDERAGAVQGLHLVVNDIESAHAELSGRGLEIRGPFHFDSGTEVDGPDPERQDYNSFMSFSDPDGNGWMVQEVRR